MFGNARLSDSSFDGGDFWTRVFLAREPSALDVCFTSHFYTSVVYHSTEETKPSLPIVQYLIFMYVAKLALSCFILLLHLPVAERLDTGLPKLAASFFCLCFFLFSSSLFSPPLTPKRNGEAARQGLEGGGWPQRVLHSPSLVCSLPGCFVLSFPHSLSPADLPLLFARSSTVRVQTPSLLCKLPLLAPSSHLAGYESLRRSHGSQHGAAASGARAAADHRHLGRSQSE